MVRRFEKAMPNGDISTIIRNLATELKKDPSRGKEVAAVLVKEFSRAKSTPQTLEQEDVKLERHRSLALGRKVRELRKSLDMSGTELSRRVDCCQAYISRVERADVEPSLTILRRIAKALGVRVSELLAVYDE